MKTNSIKSLSIAAVGALAIVGGVGPVTAAESAIPESAIEFLALPEFHPTPSQRAAAMQSVVPPSGPESAIEFLALPEFHPTPSQKAAAMQSVVPPSGPESAVEFVARPPFTPAASDKTAVQSHSGSDS